MIVWCTVDLRTGRRGPNLPVRRLGAVRRVIGEPTDAQVEVLCWDDATQTSTLGWDEGTLPGRAMLVACDEETDQPIWGGVVLRRSAGPGPWVACSVATLEHYLDRRFVPTVSYVGVRQEVIAANLASVQAGTDGIGLTATAWPVTVWRDRSYSADDDKTVLSALHDLMNVQDGVEFTVELSWSSESHRTLVKTLVARARIGRGAPEIVPVRFELPGCIAGFELIEDYSAEHGANAVQAVSSGEGETRPKSAEHVASDLLAGGWPRYERRFTPSTSITSTSVLDEHAAAELARMRAGLSQLSVTLNVDAAPRLNRDWWLGDDVTVVLTCPRFPERQDPSTMAWLPGFERTVRAVGYDLDFDARRLTPLFLEV